MTQAGDTAVATPPGQADDIRVARVHLRLGQLTLARAELEDLLRRELLDTASLAVLAEARWRTGDVAAAAEAAEAHIEGGGSDDVALCIAAEAAAADGRPTDARALMDRMPESDAATLDAIFAGMPRRAFWPAGPVDRSEIDELRREAEARTVAARRVSALPRPGAEDDPTTIYRQAPEATDVPERRAIPGPREVLDAVGDADGAPARIAARGGRPGERRMKAQLDPAAELARARTELETRPERAFLRLALVLRHDPTLAPVVLDVLHLRREAAAALLRGDAQRLLGRHLEAEAAFDAAADSLEVS
jgi:hypothetical protein